MLSPIDRVLMAAKADLYGFFMSGLAAGDPDEADEMVQLTFIKAWENWDKFKGEEGDARKAWLKTLAKSVGIDRVRVTSRRRSHEIPLSEVSGGSHDE